MYEGIATLEQRKKRAKEIYDKFIFADRLSMSSVRLYTTNKLYSHCIHVHCMCNFRSKILMKFSLKYACSVLALNLAIVMEL